MITAFAFVGILVCRHHFGLLSVEICLFCGIYKNTYYAMLNEMRDIRSFADSIGQEIAGLDKKFRLPRSGGKGAVITAAYVFADDAEEYQQAFLDYVMKEGFIADLRTKADAARQALAAAETSTGKRVGATDTLEQEIKEANKIVESLNPIIRRVYRNNPTKLAAWTYASHLERHTPKPRVPKPSSENKA